MTRLRKRVQAHRAGVLRAAWNDPSVDIVAINDLGDIENLAYQKYDSVYRQFPGQVRRKPESWWSALSVLK